ncbi:MAG TPA: hypothetical protein VLL05_07545, partial [Terriglobales bacterium]|nr:hypothetical protein [Terriglobales bacterium]
MSLLRRPEAGRDRNPKWGPVIPVSLGLAITSLILFSYLADEILRKGTDRFDESVRHLIHQQSAPWLTAVMRFVTNLGDWQVILSGTLGLLVFYWYRHDSDHIRLLLVA